MSHKAGAHMSVPTWAWLLASVAAVAGVFWFARWMDEGDAW